MYLYVYVNYVIILPAGDIIQDERAVCFLQNDNQQYLTKCAIFIK